FARWGRSEAEPVQGAGAPLDRRRRRGASRRTLRRFRCHELAENERAHADALFASDTRMRRRLRGRNPADAAAVDRCRWPTPMPLAHTDTAGPYRYRWPIPVPLAGAPCRCRYRGSVSDVLIQHPELVIVRDPRGAHGTGRRLTPDPSMQSAAAV